MNASAPPHVLETFPAIGGSEAWQRTRNVVLVRLDDVGELQSYAPICAAIADGRRRRLTLLTSKAGAAMKAHLPTGDDVLIYEAPWVDGRLRSGAADRRFLGKLASCRFDGAILCTSSTQSSLPAALFCRMAGIALRLGYSRENPYGLLTDWVAEPPFATHDAHKADGAMGTNDLARQARLVHGVGFTLDKNVVDRLGKRGMEDPPTRPAVQPLHPIGS